MIKLTHSEKRTNILGCSNDVTFEVDPCPQHFGPRTPRVHIDEVGTVVAEKSFRGIVPSIQERLNEGTWKPFTKNAGQLKKAIDVFSAVRDRYIQNSQF